MRKEDNREYWKKAYYDERECCDYIIKEFKEDIKKALALLEVRQINEAIELLEEAIE